MAKRAPVPEPSADLRPMTVEEYLRFELAAEAKHEYVAGEVSIPIPCPDATLSLDEIYEGVETDSVAEQPPPRYEATGEGEEADAVEQPASR